MNLHEASGPHADRDDQNESTKIPLPTAQSGVPHDRDSTCGIPYGTRLRVAVRLTTSELAVYS